MAQGSLFAALGYDNANRRASLSYSNGATTSYAYDLASRLTNITHSGPSGVIDALTYTYDAAGNRFSADRATGTASLLPSAVASAAYDAANEQTAFAGATLTYDANGNLTNDGVNTYQWDARNRLIGMSGGATASFAYDPLGRRASKTINGASTQFAYDGNDIAAEIGGGTVGANYLRSLNIDEPFIRQTAIGNEHYHTDALGSSLALSDASGAFVATYEYEPFGKTTATGSSSNALQYTGRENDGTGLYYYRARYYSQKLQRFLAEDPIGFSAGDINLYQYVSNGPVGSRDPHGLFAFPYPFLIPFAASLKAGYGVTDSAQIAWQDVKSDFRAGSQDVQSSHKHAMAQSGQSATAAAAANQAFIEAQLNSGQIRGIGEALHANEDRFPGQHGPNHVWDGLQWTDMFSPGFWWHSFRDWFPMPWEVWAATKSDYELLQRQKSLAGRKP